MKYNNNWVWAGLYEVLNDIYINKQYLDKIYGLSV